MVEVRKIFVYLAGIAVILGLFGIFVVANRMTGRVVEKQNLQEYSINEIMLHNTKQDCWAFSDDKAYDITLFLQTNDYDFENSCGSELNLDESMNNILKEYQIGILRR